MTHNHEAPADSVTVKVALASPRQLNTMVAQLKAIKQRKTGEFITTGQKSSMFEWKFNIGDS